jgi:plasmid maintenance system antidote protein VapI
MHCRGLTAKRLSQIAEVSEATVSHALTGKRLAAETVRRLASALSRIPPLHSADELLEIL